MVRSVSPRNLVALALCLPLAGALACANRGMEAPVGDVVGSGTGGDTGATDSGVDGPSGAGGAATGGSGGKSSTGGAGGGGGQSSTGGAGGLPATGGTGGLPGTGGTGGKAGGAGGLGGSAGGQATGGAAGSSAGGTGGAAGSPATGGTGGGGGGGGQSLPALYAYYPFDQTAGPTITDASGNARDGTLAGTATFPAGVIGNALSLPGVSGDYVALPASLLQSLTSITITLWVNVHTDHTWQRVFDFGSSQNVYMFLTSHAGTVNVARFAITTGGNGAEQHLDATALLPLATWTHVAIVLNAGGAGGTLYVNGAAVTTNAALALRPSDLGATANDWLGRSQFAADPYFDGQIDDLRIYASALTAAQITTIYTAR